MATHVLSGVRIYLDEYDFSCDLSQAELSLDVDMLDATTFCKTNRIMAPGLIDNTLSMKGFWSGTEITASSGDSVDEVYFTGVARTDALVTICPEGADAGDRAFTGRWVFATYTPGAEVGQLLAFDVSAGSRGRVTRGTVMIDGTTSRTGDFTSAKQQLGAVPAGYQLVATIHVTAFDGTSLDVDVRSDANASAGGETSRGTFTQLTAVGTERIVIAAPITDTYWDVDFTLVGTSFTAVVVLGIEPTP